MIFLCDFRQSNSFNFGCRKSLQWNLGARTRSCSVSFATVLLLRLMQTVTWCPNPFGRVPALFISPRLPSSSPEDPLVYISLSSRSHCNPIVYTSQTSSVVSFEFDVPSRGNPTWYDIPNRRYLPYHGLWWLLGHWIIKRTLPLTDWTEGVLLLKKDFNRPSTETLTPRTST